MTLKTQPSKSIPVVPAAGTNSSPAEASESLAAHSEEKYNRILHSAITVFAEHGYFNSRVSDIAKMAQVADGTIYLYFKNKEQILMATLDFAFHTFMETAQVELASIKDPRERLRKLAYLHLSSLGANRGLATVVQTELRQSAKFLAEFSHRHMTAYFDLIRSIFRDGQASGQFRSELSDKIAANCFFGALDAIVTSWLLSSHDYPLAGTSDAVMDVILSGLEKRK